MPSNMLNASIYNKYKQTSINTASPEKLLLMLYDGAIKYLHQAEKAMNKRDPALANEFLKKVQDIINELMITLDMKKGREIAENLYQLYDFYYNEVVQANLKKDPERLKPVLAFFITFRDVWAEASKMHVGVK